MRADKINSYSYKNYSTFAAANSPIQAHKSQDVVSFSGNDKKPSLIERFKKFIIEDVAHLTPEAETSDEISDMVYSLDKHSKRLQKDAKLEVIILKQYLAIGAEHNYKGYINLDEKKGKKLLFGEIDEKTGLPREVSVVNLKGGFNVVEAFELNDGLSNFQKKDYSNEGYELISNYLDGKIIYHSQLDKKDGTIREFVPSKQGFYYFLGKKDENDNPKETVVELELHYDDAMPSVVTIQNDDNELNSYEFNPKKRMWLLRQE